MELEKLVKKFNINGRIVDITSNNTGNINKTFIVTVKEDNQFKKYVIQKINTSVFNEPYLLMKNIVNVTNYCKEYLKNNNEDYNRGVLNVVKTKNNENVYRTENNEYYRMYDFVENARSYDASENSQMFYKVGEAFGHFVKMLDGYPMDSLDETIPNFHNTKARFNDFLNSVKKDPCDRVKDVSEEIDFVLKRANIVGVIVDLIEQGKIPLRVTHNDTKINNVLFDKLSNEVVCVIDLDTVMPGSALYDFGDAIRSGAAKTIEDDPNIKDAGINMEYFKNFTEAYLKETSEILTQNEVDYLAFSCILITFEQAIRFLTDYINGDTYFKCDYENHNLDRTRNQMALVKDMEKNYDLMKDVVKDLSKQNKLILKKDNKKKVL